MQTIRWEKNKKREGVKSLKKDILLIICLHVYNSEKIAGDLKVLIWQPIHKVYLKFRAKIFDSFN